MTERIIRKTVTHEAIERTFTTERKKPKSIININRKGSIVKERCRQLTEIALNLFPNRKISHEDLTYLITSSIGGDRTTVRAYMGYQGRRTGPSWGNVRYKGKPRKGYLENLGFMHRKGLHWIIHAQSTFPPASPLSQNNESSSLEKSKEKISLSHSQGASVSKGRLSDCRGRGVSAWETGEEREERENTERERNFLQRMDTKLYTNHSEGGS